MADRTSSKPEISLGDLADNFLAQSKGNDLEIPNVFGQTDNQFPDLGNKDVKDAQSPFQVSQLKIDSLCEGMIVFSLSFRFRIFLDRKIITFRIYLVGKT